MAKLLALFLVLILAALYPDKLATTLSTVDNTSNKGSASLFSTEEPNIVKNQTHLEKRINNKFINLEFRSLPTEEFVVPKVRERNNKTEQILCRARNRIIYPRSPEDSKYSWVSVYDRVSQLTNLPKAGVLVEECVNPGESCGQYFSFNVPKGVTATCETAQFYGYYQDKTNEYITKDAGYLPAYCRCVLKKCAP